MSRMSRSPRKVARVALEMGNRVLPQYAHEFAPKKFTRPQLFACLVLKRFFKTTYRGMCALLEDLPSLREELGLERVPHFTTLQHAHARMLGSTNTKRLLDQSVRMAHEAEREEDTGGGDAPGGGPEPQEVEMAAGDSTGLDATRRSKYYTRRLKQTSKGKRAVMYRRFPKLGFVCDVKRHLYLSVKATRRPRLTLLHISSVSRMVWFSHGRDEVTTWTR